LEDDSLRDTDGVGAEARFVDPMFVASDQRGKIYVADHPTGYGDVPGSPTDHGLHLRQIDAAGKVTTVLTKDDFGRPRGLLADTAGNVYVLEQARWLGRLDSSGGAVYKIAPGGTMTLIAGQTEANDTRPVDGKGTQARFARPTFAGIAPDGTLYVYDVDNTIRKVTQDGTVITVAALPPDVGVAPDGKRYGYDGETVVRIEADGSRTVVAGQKGKEGTLLGALPGALGASGGQAALPGLLTPTGLHTFALISNSAVVKLVLPH
jgi:DNA-binding beta-propeller fold protein YncE